MENRYLRQIKLPQIGAEGQAKLANSKVLVVGAGGLGSPVLYYLAAAGVGTIGIADYDVVSSTNLNRQILYKEADLGKKKATAAAAALRQFNHEIAIIEFPDKLDEQGLKGIINDFNLVVSCVDSLLTRLWIEKLAKDQDIPLVEAGIEGFSGFVLSIKKDTACLGCIIGEKPSENSAVPVMGATAGMIGSIQAMECLKILLNLGEPLYNKILYLDPLTNDCTIVEVGKNNGCFNCGI